jgi:hypothetical protein
MNHPPDCTRTVSVADCDDYSDVVESREACMCFVCAHDIETARRRVQMSEQATLPTE